MADLSVNMRRSHLLMEERPPIPTNIRRRNRRPAFGGMNTLSHDARSIPQRSLRNPYT